MPDALTARLRDRVRQVLALDARLAVQTAARPRDYQGHQGGRVDHSRPPWHAPAALAHLELHALARDLEGRARIALHLPLRERGGSEDNTAAALDALCALCDGGGDDLALLCLRELGTWTRRAAMVLGDEEVPARLPRLPGASEPRCPFCRSRTLRMMPLRGQVFCLDLDCRDDNGRRPRAALEYSPVAGDWVMVWQDGIAGVPA